MITSRLALLTSGEPNGRRLAVLLKRLNISVHIVTISYPLPKKRGPYGRYLLRAVTGRIRAASWLRTLAQWRYRIPFPQHVFYAGVSNGTKLVSHLLALGPDYILLMGGGILSREVIRTAKKGVLNVHSGLLPWIRGLDSIPNAIIKGIPVGVTAHYIDEGIDTGPILERYLIPVTKGDDLRTIILRCDELSVALMLRLAKLAATNTLPPGESHSTRTPLCRKLDHQSQSHACSLISSGRALELYEDASKHFPEIQDGRVLYGLTENSTQGESSTTIQPGVRETP